MLPLALFTMLEIPLPIALDGHLFWYLFLCGLQWFIPFHFLSPFSLLLSKAHFFCLSPSLSKQRLAQHQSWSVLWPDTRHILLVFLSVPPQRSDQPSSSCRQRWSRSARHKNLLLLLKLAWRWCFSLLSASKYLRLWMLTPWWRNQSLNLYVYKFGSDYLHTHTRFGMARSDLHSRIFCSLTMFPTKTQLLENMPTPTVTLIGEQIIMLFSQITLSPESLLTQKLA